MSLSVLTEDRGGGNPVHLAQHGPVGDLSYAWAVPRGCSTATFTLALPVAGTPVGLVPGRVLRVYDGPWRVWSGILDDPQRGTPWQFSAFGLGTLADDYAAVDGGGAPTTDANTAVDQAIIRGLPWSRPAALPTPTITQGAAGTVADLLDLVALASGQRWQVNGDGQVTMAADPTTPDYLLMNVSTPGGRTVADYATRVYGRYLNSATTPPSAAIVSVASLTATGSGPKDTFEQVVDITDRGPVTTAVATQILSGALTLQGPRAGFSGQIPVQPGGLLTPGGTPVRLSTVRAGQLVRCIGVEPEAAYGELNFTTVVDVVIGETDYDGVSDFLTLTPVGFVARDFAAVLEDLYPARLADV